ncbi:MAG: hypothetical protein MNSN_09790 [Minisyncoccus archaeiphilus]|nr:MAG: hypothetical protein MNSN_09790 [Candidatus Parcubacteria bacterium]
MVDNKKLRNKLDKHLEKQNLTEEEKDRLVAELNYLSNSLIEICLQKERKKLIRK